MKINVVGSSGSGKSTLAKRLAAELDIPYLEMDQLFWGPNWTESSDEVFFQRLRDVFAQHPAWVLDGNYSRTQSLKWQEVEMVVWVDYSFARTLFQSVKRALTRALSKKELWPNTGNTESWLRLFTKESIVWWMISNYDRNRTRYLKMMQSEDYAHIRFVQLRSPKEMEDFLNQIKTLNG